MGLYDRDYAHSRDTNALGSFAASTMVTKIIVVTVVAYLIDNFSSLLGLPEHWLLRATRLNADLFQHPWEVYRLATYGLAHAPMRSDPGIFHVAFNMYNLWLFGRQVEQKYGSKEFLALYVALTMLSGLVWVVISNLVGFPVTPAGVPDVPSAIGASGAVVGILILFVLNYPHQKFLLIFPPIPVPAWIIGLLLVSLDIRGAMGYTGDDVAFTAHLGGAAWAAIYFFAGIRLTSGDWGGWSMPKLGAPKLRVHNPETRYEQLDREADRILEKVHQSGADSLTPRERKILDDYSRRVRQRRS